MSVPLDERVVALVILSSSLMTQLAFIPAATHLHDSKGQTLMVDLKLSVNSKNCQILFNYKLWLLMFTVYAHAHTTHMGHSPVVPAGLAVLARLRRHDAHLRVDAARARRGTVAFTDG